MKQIISNYSFNATSKTVTLSDFSAVRLDRLQLIVDTTLNTILYNFADSSVATATVATNVITLSTVGSAASTDKLQIVYDTLTADPTYDVMPISDNGSSITVDATSLPLPTGAATSANQTTGNSSLSSIDTKTPSLVTGRVPVDGSGVTQPVSGTVTANAGTNLNTSALALDATLTGGTQQSKTTDGTNVANVLKSDGTAAGQNALITGNAFLPVSFTTTTVQAVASTDVGNYAWVSVHITSQGSSSTVSFQQSNDNTNWVAAVLNPATNTGQALATSTTTTGIYAGPLNARYFRLNVTGIASGTTAGVIKFAAMAPPASNVMVNAGNSNLFTNLNQVAGTTVSTGNGVSGTGVQRVTLASDSTGQVNAIQSGTWTVQPGNTANTTAWKVDGSAVTQPVSLASVPSHPVTNAGTFAVQAAAAGDVASGSTDSGNPQKIGGVGKTANPTAVTDGQRVNAVFDKLGKQVVVGSIRDLKGKQVTTITSSTTETTIVTAAGAGVFADVYGLILSNTSATACEVTIRDVTTTGTAMSIYVPAGDTRGLMLNESAAIPQGTANSAWTAQCGTSVASIKVTALYVKNT